MSSIESLSPVDIPDPSKDPEVRAAVALTRFAWGETGAEARKRYEELMAERGFSKEEALDFLRRLNSLRQPGDHESGGEAG